MAGSAGFTVDKVPGWLVLGGASQYALTINPAGDQDLSRRLRGQADRAARLERRNASPEERTPRSQWTGSQARPGMTAASSLGHTDGAGHRIVIEVPNKLGWSDDEIVAFAEGVHVTTARAGGRLAYRASTWYLKGARVDDPAPPAPQRIDPVVKAIADGAKGFLPESEAEALWTPRGRWHRTA